MKNRILISIILCFITACSQIGEKQSNNKVLATPTVNLSLPARMLFPLYVYPGINGSSWEPVAKANIYQNIDVIVNPANGVGLNKSVNYASGIAKLRAAGVGVYGYVYTSYGARSISAVKAEIDTWLLWYAPLKGIFFDEAEYRANQGDEAYYAELYYYATSKGLRVINNPGTGTTEAYAGLADTTCIFESEVTRSFTVPSWVWNYPPSKFCYLAHSANVDQMRQAVSQAKESNVGYVYITNVFPDKDFWASIPPYLAEEAELLAGGIVPSPSLTPTSIVLTPTKTLTPTLTQTPTAITVASSTPTKTNTQTSTPTKTQTPTPTLSPVFTATPQCMTVHGGGKVCYFP